MDWQPENVLGIIFGAGFVLLNKPLGEASLRWSQFGLKGVEGYSPRVHRIAFILVGLIFVIIGVSRL